MNDRDQRRYDRATRVQTFGDDNAADFDPNSKATALFASLDVVIDKLDDAKASQPPSRVSKETLIDSLTLDLKNIARTARCIALTENGFAAPYRMPDHISEPVLLSHADAVLALLEDQPADTAAVKTARAALRDRFVAFEVPDTFVTTLRTDLNAILDTNKLNQSETQGGVQNTKLIGELLGQANDLIMQLDAVMFNKYTRRPEKLQAWQSASHVERAPKHEKKTAAAPTTASV